MKKYIHVNQGNIKGNIKTRREERDQELQPVITIKEGNTNTGIFAFSARLITLAFLLSVMTLVSTIPDFTIASKFVPSPEASNTIFFINIPKCEFLHLSQPPLLRRMTIIFYHVRK